MPDQPRSNVLQCTAEVVSAHLRHNKVTSEALPQLIQSVYQAFADLGTELDANITKLEPAVPWKKSVFPDYIVCLENGVRIKLLKPYIWNRFGLTPDAYRGRWGLPSDYPMVAPSYARRRSEMAFEAGFGRKPAELTPVEAVEPQQDEAPVQPIKGRTRRKAAATSAQE